MDRKVDEVRKQTRRRERGAAEGLNEHDRTGTEQIRRIREVISEAAKMLRGDGPKGRGNG